MDEGIMTLDEEDCYLGSTFHDSLAHSQADNNTSNSTANALLTTLHTQNLHLKSQVRTLTHQLHQAQLSSPRSTSPFPTPKTFRHFPLLPPELRRRIWQHALPSARILTLDYIQPPSRRRSSGASSSPSTPKQQSSTSSYPPPRFHPLPPHHIPPTLLRTTHESRTVALTHYKWAFRPIASGTPPIFLPPPPPPPPPRPPPLPSSFHPAPQPTPDALGENSGFYFSSTHDILFFANETTPTLLSIFLEEMRPEDVARVRHLAVRSELPKECMRFVVQFRGLEGFRLVLGPEGAVGCGCWCGRGERGPRVGGFVDVRDGEGEGEERGGERGEEKIDTGRADRGRERRIDWGKERRMDSRRNIWVPGAYWDHQLTGWGRMEEMILGAFEEERYMCGDAANRECSMLPKVDFVWAVCGVGGRRCYCCGG